MGTITCAAQTAQACAQPHAYAPRRTLRLSVHSAHAAPHMLAASTLAGVRLTRRQATARLLLGRAVSAGSPAPEGELDLPPRITDAPPEPLKPARPPALRDSYEDDAPRPLFVPVMVAVALLGYALTALLAALDMLT